MNSIGNKINNWQNEETRYFLSLPLKSYIFSVIAFIGLCTTFLPWADVTVGFYAQALAVGLHFFFGWLAFLVFASIIAILLFNKYLNLQKNITAIIPRSGAVINVALTAFFILWHMFDVQYGAYLCLTISVILLIAVLFFDKIIPGKRSL